MRGAERLQRRAKAIPAGYVDARLGPGERPRDRAQVVYRGHRVREPTSSAASRRPGAEAKVGQLRDRRDVAEEPREPRVLVDEGAIRGTGRVGELRQQRAALAQRVGGGGIVLGRGGDERGARQLLQVATGDGGIGVVRGDDLALLGELEPAVDRARCAAEDRPIGGPAAAPDGAAAPMEERQLDAVLPCDRDERLLGAVEHPGRGEETGLLVRVGVAEHHLLAVAAGREVGSIARVAQQLVEDRRRRARARRTIRTTARRRGGGRPRPPWSPGPRRPRRARARSARGAARRSRPGPPP